MDLILPWELVSFILNPLSTSYYLVWSPRLCPHRLAPIGLGLPRLDPQSCHSFCRWTCVWIWSGRKGMNTAKTFNKTYIELKIIFSRFWMNLIQNPTWAWNPIDRQNNQFGLNRDELAWVPNWWVPYSYH